MNKKIFWMFLCALSGSLMAQNSSEKNALQPPKTQFVPKDRINSKEFQLSNKRVDRIYKIVDEYYNRKEKLSDSGVVAKIEEEVSNVVPLTPSVKAVPMDLKAMQAQIDKEVAKKYPADYTKLKETAKAQFAQKYPVPRKNEKITVNYYRGKSVYRCSGYFYGYGSGGSSIQINSRHIPVFDLSQHDRIRFDEKYRKKKEEQYINSVIQNIARQKSLLSQQLFSAEKKRIHRANEKAGYILVVGGQYKTAKEILKSYLDKRIQDAKKRDEYERLKKLEEEQKKGQNPDAENSSEKKAKPDEDEEDEEE